MGLIPHIDQHTAFPYWAASKGLPDEGNPLRLLHKVAKREQTQTVQVLDKEATIVASGNALELHTSEPLADPLVQSMQLRFDIGKGSSEVVGKACDNAIDRLDGEQVEIVRADGNSPDVALEFLHRFLPDRDIFG
jgi:hypothetical protein